MNKFLNDTGLSILWNRIKTTFQPLLSSANAGDNISIEVVEGVPMISSTSASATTVTSVNNSITITQSDNNYDLAINASTSHNYEYENQKILDCNTFNPIYNVDNNAGIAISFIAGRNSNVGSLAFVSNQSYTQYNIAVGLYHAGTGAAIPTLIASKTITTSSGVHGSYNIIDFRSTASLIKGHIYYLAILQYNANNNGNGPKLLSSSVNWGNASIGNPTLAFWSNSAESLKSGLPATLANWQPFPSTSQGSMYMPWLKLF